MRYLMIHKLDESLPEAWNPSQEFIEKMGAFMGEFQASGVLLAAEGVHQSSEGAIIRKDAKGLSVTDGPLAEAREVIGGFALVNVEEQGAGHRAGPEVRLAVRRGYRSRCVASSSSRTSPRPPCPSDTPAAPNP